MAQLRWIVPGVMIAAGPAFGQTASQITPNSFRPPVEAPGGAPVAPQAPALETPAGAEKLFVTISGLDVEGAFPSLHAAGEALAQKLTGRRVSGAELFAAAHDLEAAYVAAGYVLARVILPPQTLADGARLKLVVVNGFIEKVETKDVPERIRARVASVLAPLVGRPGLTLAEIERRILLAGDTPGASLHSTLAPGEKAGATVLIVDGSQTPLNGVFSLDNSLSRQLGRWSLGLGVDLNSVGAMGELVYLRATGDPNAGANGFLNEDPRNRAIAGGLVLPIGVDGLTFNVEATDARTNPVPTEGILRADVFDRLSFRLRYPWLRSRAANFNTEIALDAVEDRQTLFLESLSAPLSLDRLRVMRLSADGAFDTPWRGTLSGRVTASFGLDGLGARSASAAAASEILPLSRQFSDASFSKLDGYLSYAQPILDHLAASGFARAQTSFGQALAQSEQIGLAAPTGLSSFDAGTVQGDSGVVLRAELSSPWSLPLPGDIAAAAAPYAFGAIGAAFLQHPTALEPSRTRAASFGLGLRISGFERGGLRNGLVSVEWGRSIEAGALPSVAQTGQRLMLSLALRL